MRTCSIKDCDSVHFGLGYCRKHYWKFKKYGDPLHANIETHGMENTTEYMSWISMKTRCYNKNSRVYHWYGNRGIKICDRWKNNFAAFFEDMGLKPFPKAQIDRIDNNGNYEPSNCRWVTSAENCRNSSWVKLTVQKAKEIREKYNKKIATRKELAVLYGVCTETIGSVIRKKTWVI